MLPIIVHRCITVALSPGPEFRSRQMSPTHPLPLQSNRSTFATNMNEHSSRSHLVLSVYITAVAKTGGARGVGM